jgi:hypothetical protein
VDECVSVCVDVCPQVKTHPKSDKPLEDVHMLNIEVKATVES